MIEEVLLRHDVVSELHTQFGPPVVTNFIFLDGSLKICRKGSGAQRRCNSRSYPQWRAEEKGVYLLYRLGTKVLDAGENLCQYFAVAAGKYMRARQLGKRESHVRDRRHALIGGFHVGPNVSFPYIHATGLAMSDTRKIVQVSGTTA